MNPLIKGMQRLGLPLGPMTLARVKGRQSASPPVKSWVEAGGSATQKSSPEAKPRALRIAIVIAAAQVYRVFPILLAGSFLPYYLFPNEVGDFLVGITALPVALYLRRAGLLGWAIGAVWFALGIGDIVQAAGVAVANGGYSLLPAFALAFVLETSGLVSLLSRKTRDYVASRIR